MKKIKSATVARILKIKELFKRNNPEILFILGLFFIVYATFLINYVAGFYTVGISLIFLAFILARLPTIKK